MEYDTDYEYEMAIDEPDLYDAYVMEEMADEFLWDTRGVGHRADDDGYDFDNYGYEN